MATYYLKSITGTAGSGTGRTVWTATTAYVAGDRVVTTTSATAARQEKIYECTTGGTSGGTEPTWNATTAGTTTDNTVTWTTREPTTWANAHMFAGRLSNGTMMVAGDTVYVSDNHAESLSSAFTINGNGTVASPVKWICVDDAAEPPTTLSSSGEFTTTGTAAITLNGTSWLRGVTFNNGTGVGTSTLVLTATSNYLSFDTCGFILGTSSASSLIGIGQTSTSALSRIDWEGCRVKFGNSGQSISIRTAEFNWRNGSLISGTSTPTNLFTIAAAGSVVNIDGCDLSLLATSTNLFSASNVPSRCVIRNSKLPASWAGSLGSPTGPQQRLEMYNCDSTDTNYRLWIADYSGTVKHTTAIYNDAGATDGTTRISWLMESSANAEYPMLPLVTPEIVKWNETTGSAITVTVEIVHNSQGSGTNGVLNDDEIWLEVQYLGTSGFPLSSFITDAKASILATAAAQATSSASWTGDSAGWDTQALSVTFTPQEKGFIHAKVYLAKASATVYVDPLLTVS